MNAFTRATWRTGGQVIVTIAPLLSVGSPDRLTAQRFFDQFSYENLRPSALQLDVGVLGGTNIRGEVTGGVRLDYGFVAPKVRVLLGASYLRAEISADARRRFEERLRSLVIDPAGDDTIRLGRITWSDVTADLDLQYLLPQGRAVATYLGLGLGIHVRNGGGAAIDGTFVEDALDEVTAGLNGSIGTEIGAKRWRVTLDARGVLSSGLSTVSLRTGVMYRWAAIGGGRGVGTRR